MQNNNITSEKNTRRISNTRYKKCIKLGIVFTLISIILFFMNVCKCGLLNYSFFKYLDLIKASFVFLGLFLIGLGLIQCKNIKDKNSWLSDLPYQFDFEKEIYTHFIIGKTFKKLKIETKKYPNYTEWKDYIIKDFGYLIDKSESDASEKNDKLNVRTKALDDYRENFFRYLNSEYRFTVSYLDAIKTIIVPIEIGIIAVFCDNKDFFSSLILNVIVMIIIILETVKTESDQEFIKDFTEITYSNKSLG